MVRVGGTFEGAPAQISLMVRLKRLPWPSLTILLLGYSFAGWLLTTCRAPWLAWLGTQLVTLHLAWAGSDALALAIAWVVGMGWAGAFAIAWPYSLPWAGITVWAIALAAAWALALILALILGLTARPLRSAGLSRMQRFWVLTCLTAAGLVLGWVAAQGFWRVY
ncbi:hypothetical protein [Leptolyngbya sp. FACHB-261]|uniref:hypothetical protein n=1 Tax=Leptolyngbya sp. FACHB-261 TaxID=2692806 RepID=UPI001682C40D|nr:hypothetical protein [Leptolyngbya sp. FACHB-261]MBD2104264.1 hypothetical protein [Leptolyngbya sp. FACHB-261]